jgi:integrase/recombinase XerD
MNDAQIVPLFETFLVTEKRMAANSVAAYMSDIAHATAFLSKSNITLFGATEEDLKSYVRALHKQHQKPRTIARKVSALKVLSLFLHERYGRENAAKGLVIPKIDKTLPVYLTHDEIKHLLETAHNDDSVKGRRNYVMLKLLYATGLRVSELVFLRKDRVHFDTGFITVLGKGGKEREIPIPLSIVQLLHEYCTTTYLELVQKVEPAGRKGLLFPTVRAGQVNAITRQTFWLILKKLLKVAGITKKVSPHTLRHSLATHLLQAGTDLRSLQMWLGHEQMGTVEIYTHLNKGAVRHVYDKKHPRS